MVLLVSNAGYALRTKIKFSKPAETRQGKGKGPVDHWVAVIKPGHVLFEIAGCSLTLAREALGLADAKLPFRCRLVTRARSY